MNIQKGKYSHAEDFTKVRDFLVETFSQFEQPVNWTLERWNYARYFVIPMIGAYAKDPVSVGDSLEAIRFWEDHTRIWKTPAGEIAAVTAMEHPWLGNVFFLRHSEFDFLLEEMFADAEENLLHPEKKSLQVHIFEHDENFLSTARKRGFHKHEGGVEDITEFIIGGKLPRSALPSGFRLQSMAEENDLNRRRKAFGRGFNHDDPVEWPSLFSYQELQKAPDYRNELDLYIIAPDGEFASFCIIWWDEKNRLATLEPVGTVPEYRRMGLGRAVVYEAIRLAAGLGAEKVLVGSGQDFYLAIGFKKISTSCTWIKIFK